MEMVGIARKVCELITRSPKIFIAALNGHTLGGGLELAMACDLRLASEGDLLLGLPEINLGLAPGNGGMPRLKHLIGTRRATELLLTGDSIQPKTALEYGLVNHLFQSKTFDKDVEIFAEKLATGPAKAMAKVKYFLNQSMGMNLKEALDLESECVAPLYHTEDAKEGLKAFIEKRKPRFE